MIISLNVSERVSIYMRIMRSIAAPAFAVK